MRRSVYLLLEAHAQLHWRHILRSHQWPCIPPCTFLWSGTVQQWLFLPPDLLLIHTSSNTSQGKVICPPVRSYKSPPLPGYPKSKINTKKETLPLLLGSFSTDSSSLPGSAVYQENKHFLLSWGHAGLSQPLAVRQGNHPGPGLPSLKEALRDISLPWFLAPSLLSPSES